MVTNEWRNDADKPEIFQAPGRNDMNAQQQIDRIERVMACIEPLEADLEGTSGLQGGSTYDRSSYLPSLQSLVE